jgi:hypothetical protein
MKRELQGDIFELKELDICYVIQMIKFIFDDYQRK